MTQLNYINENTDIIQPIIPKNRKVHLVSLGCSRNRVDAEVVLGTMFNRGWEHTEEPSEADAIIVNTCGFIQSAKEESIDQILEAASYKENPNLKLVVSGCLTQRYRSQLAKGLPEVDLFVGTDEFARISELIDEEQPKGAIHTKRTNYLYNETLPRINTLAKASAYVKVAEGCQHNCSFCIIPAIRGRLRSRPITSIVNEVKKLVEDGVLEINLIAQDLAAYGREHNQDLLLPLLKELIKIDGLKWIRPLYMYPENITDEYIELLKSSEKIVRYLDIPTQHASDKILTAMNRQVSKKDLVGIVKKLRKELPDMTIRTSVMVGFPGETNEDFDELVSFVKEMEFDHLGCFSYSQEEGTVAGKMQDQVPEEVKTKRQHKIMTLQQKISSKRLKRFVGKTLPILVQGPSEEHDSVWQGRLATQAPEVDGIVYITDGKVQASSMQRIKITDSHEYDLVGSII